MIIAIALIVLVLRSLTCLDYEHSTIGVAVTAYPYLGWNYHAATAFGSRSSQNGQLNGDGMRITQHFVQMLFIVAMALSVLCSCEAVAQQSIEAADPSAGLRLFLSTGCGACHRIAGTYAQGKIAPDLTHLASRAMIGANLLP